MDTLRMAWRNVWRNRRRSIITMAAMALALWTMTLYSGMVAGYLGQMERSILDYEVGDLQVFAAGYQGKPSIYTAIDHSADLVAQLDRAGFPSSARLLGGGLAAAGDSSAGVSIRGIDIASDARVSLVGSQVAEGQWLDAAAPNGVVIGRRLARTLAVSVGAELVILSQGADGSTANRLYTVRGVLRAIAEATDRSGVFMTDSAFRELMVWEGGAHQIIVRRPEGMPLGVAAAAVRAIGAVDPRFAGLDFETWRQLMPTMASLLDSATTTMFVMFCIVYLAIAIVILNAMLMAVFERIREFGMLKAIGMGPGKVMTLVLLESAFQTAIAIAAGLALCIPAGLYLARVGIDRGKLGGASMGGMAADPIWRAAFSSGTLVGPIVTLVVIVSLAVLYPGIKAARLNPVDAMRHQ